MQWWLELRDIAHVMVIICHGLSVSFWLSLLFVASIGGFIVQANTAAQPHAFGASAEAAFIVDPKNWTSG